VAITGADEKYGGDELEIRELNRLEGKSAESRQKTERKRSKRRLLQKRRVFLREGERLDNGKQTSLNITKTGNGRCEGEGLKKQSLIQKKLRKKFSKGRGRRELKRITSVGSTKGQPE